MPNKPIRLPLYLIILGAYLGLSPELAGQSFVGPAFKDTRVINTHSVETVPKGKLDFRVGHRFGDLAGNRGGWKTFYGLENASDVYFGFEYGITESITASISRSKGAGPLRQLVHGYIKARLLRQQEVGSPLSITLVGLSSLSTMQKSDNPELLSSFETTSQRMAHHAQLLLARKFSDRFSLQLSAGLTHRNRVAFNEENDIFSIGLATRIQLNRVFGLIIDATYPISDRYSWDRGYYFPLGIGFEIGTGGHVFQINFTNSNGIVETDYIPYSSSNWEEGEFRLGFTISRLFNF